jgi:hypothetical protein
MGENRIAWWIKKGIENPSITHKARIRKKLSKIRQNENNPAWKNEKVGYKSLHQWIQRKKGKAKICAICQSNINIDWANIDPKYSRDLKDWISLCKKCHGEYDTKMGIRKKGGFIKNHVPWNKGKKAQARGDKN